MMFRAMILTLIAVLLVLMQSATVFGNEPAKMQVLSSLEKTSSQNSPQQPDYDSLEIGWDVLSGGGRMSTTTGFIHFGSMGQFIIGKASASDVEIHSGYWQDFGPGYPCGDANESDNVDIDDIIFIINYIYGGGPAPDPLVGNANCLEAIDIDDVIYIVNYIFGGGPAPCANCPY